MVLWLLGTPQKHLIRVELINEKLPVFLLREWLRSCSCRCPALPVIFPGSEPARQGVPRQGARNKHCGAQQMGFYQQVFSFPCYLSFSTWVAGKSQLESPLPKDGGTRSVLVGFKREEKGGAEGQRSTGFFFFLEKCLTDLFHTLVNATILPYTYLIKKDVWRLCYITWRNLPQMWIWLFQ